MNDNTDEIDIIEQIKKIYNNKFFIIKTTFLAALFGIIYALVQPNEFTSTSTFIPQLSTGLKSGSSSLSGLASLAGINIGGLENSEEFPPSLYPQVVSGTPFRLDLLSSKIEFENEIFTVKDYFLRKSSSNNIISFLKKYTIDLPKTIINFFKIKNSSLPNFESKIYEVTETDMLLFGKIESSLSLLINDKEGFITISFTDKNKNVAAQINENAKDLLQEKIIEFKNKSSKEILDFAMKQYKVKQDLYEKLQDERAVFVDKNINISSSLFQNKLSRIEREVNISESIVQQLASQVEQAKLQVNKDTPVFTTIQPVTVPYYRTSPKRTYIVLFSTFLGFIFSTGFILFKHYLIDLIKSLKS